MANTKELGENPYHTGRKPGAMDTLMRQFDLLNLEVQGAARSNNPGYMLDTFVSVLTRLPEISRKLAHLSLKSKGERDACAIFQEGLNSYTQACEYYRKALIADNADMYHRARLCMNDARNLLSEAVRLLRQQ